MVAAVVHSVHSGVGDHVPGAPSASATCYLLTFVIVRLDLPRPISYTTPYIPILPITVMAEAYYKKELRELMALPENKSEPRAHPPLCIANCL